MTERPPLLTISDTAAERIKYLIGKSDKPVEGLRVGVSKGGCSGLSYQIDYAEEAKDGDELVEDKGVKVFIDPAATLYLIGTEMDYIEKKLESRFVFINPNVKTTCGCGESFNV